MKLYRRLPEPGGELKRKRGDTHAGAVKQGGPQGSAANATVLIPPLGNAQHGEEGGTQEKRKAGDREGERRGRGKQADLRGGAGGGLGRGGDGGSGGHAA